MSWRPDIPGYALIVGLSVQFSLKRITTARAGPLGVTRCHQAARCGVRFSYLAATPACQGCGDSRIFVSNPPKAPRQSTVTGNPSFTDLGEIITVNSPWFDVRPFSPVLFMIDDVR